MVDHDMDRFPERESLDLNGTWSSSINDTLPSQDGKEGVGENTLEPGHDAGGRSDMPRHPDYYQLVRLLGRGGMGRVYEAIDLRLDRHVAIKFVNGGGTVLAERFLREAQALARVEHEHFCKIYEVGEFDYQPFIVMQLIGGQTLSAAAIHMPLEARLKVLGQVAEALHQAHRAGLIHRDLKPGNIMVERHADGTYKPYVLDFGLARLGGEPELTVTGDILGTPGYMAPEQARGELEKINNLTDVYGLGATLYFLCTGYAPFSGNSGPSILVELLEKEPTPPRKRKPDLPADVETIILKSIEKRQEDRYGSALELAEDVKRYLAGDPILARPASVMYRLQKQVRKHRLPLGLGTVALLLISIALVWGEWQASRRESFAGYLTNEVKEIEALARFSALSRAHDIRPDRQRLAGHMDRIRTTMDKAGEWGEGLSNYALGWGYLVTSDERTALRYLEEALKKGLDDPRLDYALGLAYSARLRRMLTEFPPRERQANTYFAVESKRLRLLAVSHMDRSFPEEVEGSPHYISALIAYCEAEYEDALFHLSRVPHDEPWFYEAHKLRADIQRDWAADCFNEGKVEQARTLFSEALFAYDQAIDVGQSDPANYKAAARALGNMMTMDMFGSGDLDEYVMRGLDYLERSARILPGDEELPLLEATFRRRLGQHLRLKKDDPTEQYLLALQGLQPLLTANADKAVLLEVGTLLAQLAQWLHDQGLDGSQAAEQAIALLETVPVDQRNYLSCNLLGLAYRRLARSLAVRGEAVAPLYGCAVEALEQALHLRPDRIAAYNNLAQCLYHSASSQPPDNARGLLQEAEHHLEKAIELAPQQVALRYQMSRVLMTMAMAGEPDASFLDEAISQRAQTHIEAGLAVNPEFIWLYERMNWNLLLRAQFTWQHGGDPEPLFSQIFANIDKALTLGQRKDVMMHHLATSRYYRGKYLLRQGMDPTEELRLAEVAVAAANPEGNDEARLIEASIWRLRAEYALLRGANSSASLSQARKGFEDILQHNPHHEEAHRSLARVHTLAHRSGVTPYNASRKALEELEATGPIEAASLPVLLAWARLMIAAADSEVVKEVTLRSLREALQRYESVAEALAASACVDYLLDRDLAMAKKQMGRALAGNPHLRFEWEAYLP